MTDLPQAPHPDGQMTTAELAAYIDDLRQALYKDLDDKERDTVLRRLGAAYAEQNDRARTGAMPPVPEQAMHIMHLRAVGQTQP